MRSITAPSAHGFDGWTRRIPAMRAFRAAHEQEFKSISDHNVIKGYSCTCSRAAIEKVGKLRSQGAGPGAA